jgi:hypothetical protein
MNFKKFINTQKYKVGQKVVMVSHKKGVPNYDVTIKKLMGDKVQVEYTDHKGKKHLKKISLLWLMAFHKRIGENHLQQWINEIETHVANE